MRTRSTLRYALAVLAVASLATVAAIVASQRSDAQAATLGDQEAAALAVKYAQDGTPSTRMSGMPTEIHAKLTTLGDAYQLMDGRPLDPATALGADRNRAVWLVFLRGNLDVRLQAPVGKPAPPTGPTYHQMAVILDANTGELLGNTIYTTTAESSVAPTLPQVPVPATVDGISVQVIRRPAAPPLPTRTPI